MTMAAIGGVSPFARALVRSCTLSSLVVLLGALGAGAVRLLPWLMARDVPVEVTVEFAKGLAAVALETAVFIGTPLGASLAAALFIERGEARALFALGVSPLELVRTGLPLLGAWAALLLMLSMGWQPDRSRPGHGVNQLIAGARKSCEGAIEPRSAAVPMLNVVWLCFPGGTPRAAGPLPGSSGRAWFTAERLTVTPSLDALVLRELRVSASSTAKPAATLDPDLRLHARTARISTAVGWAQPRRVNLAFRTAIAAVTAASLGGVLAWLVLRQGAANRVLAAALGAGASAAGLSILQALDRLQAHESDYLLVPVAAIGLAILAGRLLATGFHFRRL
jgi:hypothetical protein